MLERAVELDRRRPDHQRPSGRRALDGRPQARGRVPVAPRALLRPERTTLERTASAKLEVGLDEVLAGGRPRRAGRLSRWSARRRARRGTRPRRRSTSRSMSPAGAPDGYHLLDSLVVFAARRRPSRRPSRPRPVAHRRRARSRRGLPAAARTISSCARRALLRPAAAGAALRARQERCPSPAASAAARPTPPRRCGRSRGSGRAPLPARRRVLALGADVPVCLAGRRLPHARASASASTPLAPAAVLDRPGQPRRAARDRARSSPASPPRDNPPMPPAARLRRRRGARSPGSPTQRNDLEAPRRAVAPADRPRSSRRSPRSPAAALARMSGLRRHLLRPLRRRGRRRSPPPKPSAAPTPLVGRAAPVAERLTPAPPRFRRGISSPETR